MSNITIAESEVELASLPLDILLTPLSRYSKDGVFTGKYAGPGRGEIENNFERNLARIYERADTPRLSGVQIKAPMYLDPDGVLSPATGKPFTHILKPAGTGGYDALSVVEWTAMTLGRRAGFAAPDVTLVAMPDGMPPALVVERFDIRENEEDARMLALEDLCAVLGLPVADKYKGTMERVARAVRPLSTSVEEDLLIVVRRALFAWLIADGDMHLKNIALLRIAEERDKQFRSVRMAPLYDVVTTRVFPNLKHDRLALKLAGKDDNLRRADFRALATSAGLKSSDADAAIDEMVARLGKAVSQIKLPKGAGAGKNAQDTVAQVLDLCRSRVELFR
jgi:serine/threonine-protein kinase HipA